MYEDAASIILASPCGDYNPTNIPQENANGVNSGCVYTPKESPDCSVSSGKPFEVYLTAGSVYVNLEIDPVISASQSIDVNFTAPTATTINNGETTAVVCGGTPALLTATEVSASLYEGACDGQVIAGQNTYMITTLKAGNYTVRYKDTNGCWSKLSNPIEVLISSPLVMSWTIPPPVQIVKGLQQTAFDTLYAARLTEVVNVTMGLPPALSGDNKESDKRFHGFVPNDPDMGALYTSGHCSGVLEGFLSCYIQNEKNRHLLIPDVISLLNRIREPSGRIANLYTLLKVRKGAKDPALINGKLPDKKTILAFYDSGCGNCTTQMMELARLLSTYSMPKALCKDGMYRWRT